MATRERVGDGEVAVPMGGCALGESDGVEVGPAVGARVPRGGCALGATVAVGDGAVMEVAVGTAVGVPVGVLTGVEVPMRGCASPTGGCALGPAVEVGGGTSGGLLGEQAAASSPAAKVLRARRKLRREMGLVTGEWLP